jgi:glyoxylase-like metal-dependent hydrolase (beta-lactamase superfamily II)
VTPVDKCCSRRSVIVATAGSCAVHLARSIALAPWMRTALHTRVLGRVVAREPFGRLEVVAPGVWALISDPFGGDRTTLANGAIIAGRNGVLLVEGLYTPVGAKWLAEQARALTGRTPTHVALTHHHADHADGIVGHRDAAGTGPRVIATRATMQTVTGRARVEPALAQALAGAELVASDTAQVLDLGGVAVSLVPRAGHTASDLTVVHEDAKVVVGGDLLFNAIFPNYVDAVPSTLAAQVRALRQSAGGWRYIPGHGAVMQDTDIAGYLVMLDAVEAAARAAYSRGDTAAAAAAAWSVPASLGTWRLFGPAFLTRAFVAWYQELDGD